MTIIDAIILGIVQGLTEFFPVSSSGHLQLVQYLLDLRDLDRYILFDLACHLGTLCAIIIGFFAPIRQLFEAPRARLLQVVIATLPLFPLVFLLKPIKAFYSDPSALGSFFLLTAAILFAGEYFGRHASSPTTHPRRDALFIGLWQALAILPGVSRSGSTISGARLLGWEMRDAVIFSFLLAIPAVMGGTVLEVWKLWRHAEVIAGISLWCYIAGFFVSFIVGMGALRILFMLIERNKFFYFAWYCLLLGLATTVYFHYTAI